MITMTGKTQSDIDAEARVSQISSLKDRLASLDAIINRPLEDLYSLLGQPPFDSVQAVVDKKKELRSALAELNG